MGRIRTIKPEFPQSESVGRLSRDARLLFILLWTIADDTGRARAASRAIASLLFPYDEDAPSLVGGWLDELEGAGKIRRYEVGGSTYLEIVKWLDHQKIDKPSGSKFPAFAEGSRIVAEPSRNVVVGPRTKDQDQGRDPDQDIAGVASATPGARYSDEFENEFWKPYPRTPVMSKAEAWKAWQKARSADERAKIIAAVPQYSAYLKTKPDLPAVHACRFISQRRFEGFGEVADVPALPPGKFYAAVESPELDAWDKHFRDTRGRGIPRDKAGGWRVDSQWPPGHVLADGGKETTASAQQIELR